MSGIGNQRALAFGAAVALAFCAARLPVMAQGRDLYNNTNTGGVMNGPTGTTAFSLSQAAQVSEIVTYHWNNGRGANPGTIVLQAANGRRYGPFQTHGTAGQGNAPNVNWIADVNVTLPAGNYLVLDSNPGTWSQNAGSAYRGFVIVRGSYLGRTVPGNPAPPAGSTLPTPPRPPVSGPVQPAPAQPTPSIPRPCHGTTYAQLELAQPCFGPVGTMLHIVVVRQLPGPLAGVVFKPGPIGSGSGQRTPSATMAVTVSAGGAGSNGLILVSGSGLAPGSVFELQAPAGLCMPGRGNWTWDVWAMWPGGRLQGDIDDFTVQC